MSGTAVFAYGSLVSPRSAALTLGRPLGKAAPARLEGWRRRWSQRRDNLTCEKTFARRDDGHRPTWVLGLNLEPSRDPSEAPNGVLIDVDADELARFDLREMRYDRVEVTGQVRAASGGTASGAGFDRIVSYTAKRDHFAPTPPADAIILASYAREVEAAFAALGEPERLAYLATSGPFPVEVVEGVLVRERIPEGNPRDW
jgi:hypothetical protein